MVIPGITMVCAPPRLDDIGCKGAPDLITGILPPPARQHGKLTKFNCYQRAGVREYWIGDPTNKSVQVFVLEDGHYAAKDDNVTYDDTREIFEHNGVTVHTGDLRTLFEIRNAKDAYELFLSSFQARRPLDEAFIKELQFCLTKNTYDARRW